MKYKMNRSGMMTMNKALYAIHGVVFVTLAGLVPGNLGLLESMYEVTLRSKWPWL